MPMESLVIRSAQLHPGQLASAAEDTALRSRAIAAVLLAELCAGWGRTLVEGSAESGRLGFAVVLVGWAGILACPSAFGDSPMDTGAGDWEACGSGWGGTAVLSSGAEVGDAGCGLFGPGAARLPAGNS